MKYLFGVLMLLSVLQGNVLQKAIDSAPEGSILKLPAGIYSGKIVIDKPLTIVGKEDGVVIDGGGNGTVVEIKSSYVTLKNVKVIGSGALHHQLDAGIKIEKAKQCEVSNVIIDDCLFGIDMQMTHNSIIQNNIIYSKKFDLGLRGDGLRLWYSNDNIIKKNSLIKSRDMVVWYSHGNIIEENYGKYNRYSLHFMYAGKNYVRNNLYEFNSVGIFFMYSQDTIARNNIVKSSLGATGMGIGFKEISNFTVEDNTVLYCARGLYVDRSPFQPGTNNFVNRNKILYNSEAIHFHSISQDNIFKDNIIQGNIEDIVNDSRGSHTSKNVFEKNYWDNYEGFDRDKDGVGDTPHTVYQYADKLWIYNPSVKFFYGSPIISLLNFLAKLAPFSEPLFLLEDPKPAMQASIK
jgi:nitrous oxidase accessory protein